MTGLKIIYELKPWKRYRFNLDTDYNTRNVRHIAGYRDPQRIDPDQAMVRRYLRPVRIGWASRAQLVGERRR